MNDARTTTDLRDWIGPLAIGLLVVVAVQVGNVLHARLQDQRRTDRMQAIAEGIAGSIKSPSEISASRAAELSRLSDARIVFRSPDRAVTADGPAPGSARENGAAIPGAPGWRLEAWLPRASSSLTWLPWACGGITVVLVGIAQSRRRWELNRLRSEIAQLESTELSERVDDTVQRLSMPGSRPLQSVVQPLNDLLGAWAARIQRLEVRQHQSDLVLDSIASGVIVIRTNGSIEYINPAACRLFETSLEDAEKFVGLDLSEAVREPEVHEMVARVMSSRQTLRRTFLASRSKGDQQCELATTVAPILDRRKTDSDPQLAGAVILIEDATDLRRLERARTDFVGNVSHELRTPLTNLLGYLSTAREMESEDPQQGKFLEVAERNAERLASIIEDLLALARLEAPGIELERHPVRLKPLLEQVANHHRTSLSSDPARLEVLCSEGLEIMGSASLIEQAVENLTTNAIRYGNPEGRVRIQATRQKTSIEILVTDDGPGISPRHAERIFERFYRVDTARSRDTGGTGLGLAIVKHIAVAHGGSVEVESQLGVGSTFRLEFPLPADSPASESEAASMPDRRMTAPGPDPLPTEERPVP